MSVTVAPLVVAIIGLGEAGSAAPALASQRIYADLHTTTPSPKRAIASTVEPTAALFADIALLASAPRHGIHTPVLAAGVGANQFQAACAPFGVSIEVASDAANWLRQLANTTTLHLSRPAVTDTSLNRRGSPLRSIFEGEHHAGEGSPC